MRRDWTPYIALLLFAVALALRLVAPSVSPPGFNDDELSNALVINQLVRDGDIRLYYPHASGHEGLYHLLSAPLLPLFGENHVGIRGLSILLGALSAALLYLLAQRMWGRAVGIIAALGLAFSFWSLVYSRVGQRHISLPAFALLAFYCWWRGLGDERESPPQYKWFAAAGAALGVGFYTYFAARGVPLILIAFAGYLYLFHRETFKRHWRGMALALLIAAALAVPLLITLQQNPAAEARVDELAAPLHDLRDGDPSTLLEYAEITLGMFTFTGDDEALYNIPGRPVFGIVGGALFYLGVALTVWRWRRPANAFLLLWMAAGLAPGAMSVPAASLGHTILAQPAAFVFPAISIAALAELLGDAAPYPALGKHNTSILSTLVAFTTLYMATEAWRNLQDYFTVRPEDGFTRVLFHHDFVELARYLNEHDEITDVVIGAQINERWNQQAFEITLDRDDVRARWHDPRASVLWAEGDVYWALPHYFFEEFKESTLYRDTFVGARDFLLVRQVEPGYSDEQAEPFALGLTHVYSYLDERSYAFSTRWRVDAPLDLPPNPLYSKPPAPGEPNTPRLEMFVHVLRPGDDAPGYATGGLGVDPYTLQVGDFFNVTGMSIPSDLAPGSYRIAVGLFDPWTGERYLTEDGREMVVVSELEVPE
jgi:4-amino-4-deoxy-L-arabinose transferase-like glycosyltransferase